MGKIDEHNGDDACAGFGPVQQWATVWFFAVIAIGTGMFVTLRNTDYFNFQTNGEYFDMQAWRENRIASTTVHGDGIDERMHGDLVSAREKLAAQK